MDGIRGSGYAARLVNQELHRPEKAPPPPEASKLALVHQELHRPPTSLRATPGNGPVYGFNPALDLEKPPATGGTVGAVDALIQRAQQAAGGA